MQLANIHTNLQSSKAKIFIYSCGIEHNCNISKLDFSLFHAIFASQALLDEYITSSKQNLSNVEIYPIGAKAKEDAKHIINLAKDNKKILVLCSGDALYHGFGGTILECAKNENIHNFIEEFIYFEPNITAFQALFHKIGLAWSKASLFSVHNYSALPLQKILSSQMPVIYGGTIFPAHIIAKEIIKFNQNYANEQAVVAEYLGYSSDEKQEKIVKASLEEIAQMHFAPTSILLLPQNEAMLAQNILPLGLEENFFSKDDNLITASDARAIILSRLRLPRQGTLWDLGAGSGSVGLEAAALCPNLQVHGIEKNEKRIVDIQNNKQKLGLDNYTIHHADIIEKIKKQSLPLADRIFIGGGGKDIIEIANLAKNSLKKGGIMVLSAVTLETFTKLHAWQKEQENVSCIKLDIAKEKVLAKEYSSFKQANTLYIFTYQS